VHVLDERTLAIPDYDGNGMYRTWGNVLVNPRVGLLFLDFESPKRIRVNGTARVRDGRSADGRARRGRVHRARRHRDDLPELPALPAQDEAARALGPRAAPAVHAADSRLEDVRRIPRRAPGPRYEGES
jgi:hypothetical protein